jgi:uncharacterized membrane protein YhaH (DUF805 family)
MTLWQTLFGFEGRIGRGVFWFSLLAVALLELAVAALVSDWVYTRYVVAQVPLQARGSLIAAGLGFSVVTVASAWIGLALKIKRAHDVDHSGWWLAVALIPIYGPIRLLIDLGFRPGSRRRNRFGPPAGHLGDIDDLTPVQDSIAQTLDAPARAGMPPVQPSRRAAAGTASLPRSPARIRRSGASAPPANDVWAG